MSLLEGLTDAVFAIVLALVGIGYGAPGQIYTRIGPVMAWHGVRQSRGVERLQ